MMREMKYIVTRNLENDKEEIFIFPKSVNHDCMAEVLECIKNQSWVTGNVNHAFLFLLASLTVKRATVEVNHSTCIPANKTRSFCNVRMQR